MRRSPALRTALITVSALTALALGAGSALAADGPRSATSTAGDVTAELTWNVTTNEYDLEETRGYHLKITRAGTVTNDAALVVANCDEPYCRMYPPAGKSEVLAKDLDNDGTPEVMLLAFTGGAHCCTIAVVYTWDGTKYVPVVRELGDASITIKDYDSDKVYELLSNDAAFTYAFTSYAGSWLPPLTLRFVQGAFVDVTRKFPARIRTNAAEALRYARKSCSDEDTPNTGLWAGWAADQYLLGKRLTAIRSLRNQMRAGCIHPASTTYVAKVDSFLKKLGYHKK